MALGAHCENAQFGHWCVNRSLGEWVRAPARTFGRDTRAEAPGGAERCAAYPKCPIAPPVDQGATPYHRHFGACMIPTNARKKFQFNVTPSDRQLWAIGMVIVQWTSIEQTVKVFVHAFTDENDPDDPIRRKFDATRSMQLRLDLWAELTNERIQPSWRTPLHDLINKTRQIQDMRDKIVHGTWSDKENAQTVLQEAHGPFSWGKPGHAFSWKLDYQGILNVALRIDSLHKEMFDFAFRANGQTQGREWFMLGQALRKIQIPRT